MEDVLVSIWCTTYNHELYIRDALNGFLSQKTNFKYEIVIHDDASTDKTAEIIREYERNYPELIHAIYQKENQYSKNLSNNRWLHDIKNQNCRGKYIAACEGDDYWVDSQKLQLQVEYLEAHTECILTTHKAVDIDCRSGDTQVRNMYEADCIVPIEDIIMQKVLIPTASIVYRKEVSKMDNIFLNAGIGDYPLLLFAVTKGTIYYFNRPMSIYRYCHEGSWTVSVLENDRAFLVHNIQLITFLRTYNNYMDERYSRFIISKIQKHVDTSILLYKRKRGCGFIQDFTQFCGAMNEEYYIVLKKIERLYLQISDEYYLSRELQDFIKAFPRIVIMGAGKYAGIVAKQLKTHKVFFEGFVVSNDQNANKNYLGKTVWKFSEIPFDLNNLGIIIGINPVIWDEIMDTLEKESVKNYMCPFLLG